MTPKLAKIAVITLFLNVPIKTKNSPKKPLVPGKPSAPSVNTTKSKEYLGKKFTTPP